MRMRSVIDRNMISNYPKHNEKDESSSNGIQVASGGRNNGM
jgi:hypothetical protein